MAKQRLITPADLSSQNESTPTPSSGFSWDNVRNYNPTSFIEANRGLDAPHLTADVELPQSADPAYMQELGVAWQSFTRSWLNHFQNYIDELHKSEIQGERQLMLKKLDEGDFDDEDSLRLVELDQEEAEYDEEIAGRPVNKDWLARLEQINAEGSAAFLSGNHMMQLSEDLAGTAMYMLPQMGVAALTMGATALAGPLGAGAGGALAVSIGSMAANVGVLAYTRHMESLAELGDAYDNRMLEWAQEYRKNNPDATQEQFFAAKAEAETQARKGLDDLYQRNMTLLIPDAVGQMLMLGSFGPAARMFKSSTPLMTAGKHALINPMWQYYSEGVWEEGSQYNWQKEYMKGEFDEGNSLGSNVLQAYTTDLAKVLNSAAPGLLGPADVELYADKEFHSAIGRGGKSAALMGLIPGLFHAAHTAYKYGQVKSAVAEHIPHIKQEYNAKKSNFLFDILDSSKQGMYEAAVRSHVKAGNLTEEEGNKAIKDLKDLDEIYSKIDDLLFTYGSSLKNRLDKTTRKEAFVLAQGIKALENEKAKDLARLRESSTLSEFSQLLEGSKENSEKLIAEREQFWDNRINGLKEEFKKVARGDVRRLNANYKAAVSAANDIKDATEKGKALARAELDYNIALQRRTKKIYGDEQRTRVHINNLNILGSFNAEPTIEKAEELVRAAGQTRTPILKQIRDYIADKLQTEIPDLDELERELGAAELEAERLNTDEAWQAYDEVRHKVSEAYAIRSRVEDIRERGVYNIPEHAINEDGVVFTLDEEDNLLSPMEEFYALQDLILEKSAESKNPQEFQDNAIVLDMLQDVFATAEEAANNPSFGNVGMMEQSIGKLKQFIDYLEGKNELSNKLPITSNLKELLDILEGRQEQVQKNANSNKVKSEKIYEWLLNLPSDGRTFEEMLDNLMSESAEARELTLESLRKERDAILADMPPGIGNSVKVNVLGKNDSLLYDPFDLVRFTNLLADDSLHLVMRHGSDFNAILDDIKNGNGNTLLDMEEAEDMVKKLNLLVEIEFYIAQTKNKIDVKEMFDAIQRIGRDSVFPPNGEQLRLLLFLAGAWSEGSSYALTGYAGSGKTVTIGNLISMLLSQGVSREEIGTTAKIDRIREAMSEKTGVDALEYEKLAEQMEGINYLIVDESGYLTQAEIENIEAFKKANPKLRILYVGDPNQLNADGRIFSPFKELIKQGKIQGSPALTIINRTAVLPLRDFQSRFMSYTMNNSPVTGKHNASQDTGLVTTDLQGAINAFNALKGTKMFIVDDASIEQVAAAVGEENVAYADEVQGMEFDHVFIAIRKPSKDDYTAARWYNMNMYVASTRATESIHYVTEDAISNTVVDNVPLAEVTNFTESKERYNEVVEKLRSEQVIDTDEQEDLENEVEEEMSGNEPEGTEETEETDETDEEGQDEPDQKDTYDSDVPTSVKLRNKKTGKTEVVDTGDHATAEGIAETAGSETKEEIDSDQVVDGLLTTKGRRKKQSGGNWWKLPFTLSKAVKSLIGSETIRKAFAADKPAQATVTLMKTRGKDVNMYVQLGVSVNDITVGTIPFPFKDDAAARSAIASAPNKYVKEVMEAAYQAYLADPNFTGIVEIGTINVEKMTHFSTSMDYKNKLTLTKQSVQLIKDRLKSTVFKGEKINKMNHHVFINVGVDNGNIDTLINSVTNMGESNAIAALKENNDLINQANKSGHPFLIITVEKASGNWQAIALPIQPRKLRSSDKITQAIKEFVDETDAFQTFTQKNFPDTKGMSLNKMLAYVDSRFDTMSKEMQELYGPYIYTDGMYAKKFREMQKYLTWLYQANRQIRKGKFVNLSFSELRRIAYEFDKEGNSTFVKEGSRTKEGFEYTGLYIPVQLDSNENLKYNIDLVKPRGKNVSNRSHLGHLFTIGDVSFEGTEVEVSSFKPGKPIVTEETDEATTPLSDEQDDISDDDISDLYGDMGPVNLRSESTGTESLISVDEAQAIIQRLLPKASQDDVRFLTQKAIEYITGGRSKWGMETAQNILVAKLKDGIYKEALRHELFHRVFRTMDERTKDVMRRAWLMENPGNEALNEAQIEEELAKAFETYERKPESFVGRLKAFFKRIAAVLGFYRANYKTITEAFQDIENSVYKGRKVQPDNQVTNFSNDILAKFPDIQAAINTRDYISQHLASAMFRMYTAPTIAETRSIDIREHLLVILANMRKVANEVAMKENKDDNDLRLIKIYQALGILPLTEGESPTYNGFAYIARQITGIRGLSFTSGPNPTLKVAKTEGEAMEQYEEELLEAGIDVNDAELERQDGWRIDADYIDVTKTLTETTKLFTRIVPKYKNEQVVGVENSGKIYKVLVDLFQEFVPEGNVYTALNKFLTKAIKETTDKSVKAALLMLQRINYKAGTPTTFSNGRFVLMDRFEFLADPEATNSGLLGTFASEANNRNVVIVHRGEKSTAAFLSVIKTKMLEKGYTEEDFNRVKVDRKITELQDLRNSLLTHFQSPYQKNLMTAYANHRDPRQDNAYAYEEAFDNNHRTRVVKMLQDPKDSVFSEKQIKALPKHIKAIDRLIQQVPKMREDLKGLREAAVKVYQDVFENTSFHEEVPNLGGYADINKKLKALKLYLESVPEGRVRNVKTVADALYHFSVENVPSSIQDGGRSLYVYSPGSSATMVFRSALTGKTSEQAQASPFFKWNPIATSNNGIRRLVQHLKIVERNPTGNSKENNYSSETDMDYWYRQINYSFIQQFRKGAFSSNGFISWVYTISDKPKAIGVKVMPVKESEKANWIKMALDQEADLVNRDVRTIQLQRRKRRLLSDKPSDRQSFAFMETPFSVQEYMAMTEKQKVAAAQSMLKELEKQGNKLADSLDAQGFFADADASLQTSVTNYLEAIGVRNKNMEVAKAKKFMIKEAFVQNYLTRHFVNQMIVGDLNVYKNDVDLIKRMAGPFAPGTLPIMNTDFSTRVIQDDVHTLNSFFDPDGTFKPLHGTSFDATDAQQFRSYKRALELMRAMGSTADIGFVDKPVVDFIDPTTGEKFYNKMAVLTLTPSLTRMFYKAARMSQIMQTNGIDELTYKSGSKAGHLSQMEESFFGITDRAGNILIPSTAYRQQQATTSDIGKSDKVVLPSQLVYHLLNSASKNVEAANVIYSEIAEIINSKRKLWEGKTDSQEGVIKLIKQITKDDPQNSFIYDLVDTMGVDALSVFGVTKKINQLLLSKFYKEIQEIKFKGMKLQLVADTFVDLFDIDGTTKTLDKLSPEQHEEVQTYYDTIEGTPHLEEFIKTMKKYKAAGKLEEFYSALERENKSREETNAKRIQENENKHVDDQEPILPIIDADAIRPFEDKLVPRNLEYFKLDEKTGRRYAEVVMPNAYRGQLDADGMLSHDAMRAIGFRLPSTDLHSAIAIKPVAFYDENGQATPIIAPKEIIVLHGSDNDADTLNVLQKEVHKKNKDLVVGDITYKKGDIYGEVQGYEKEIANLVAEIEKNPTNKNELQRILRYMRQNRIVETFLDVITDPKNEEEMLTPISFDPLLNEKPDEKQSVVDEDRKAFKKNPSKFINDPDITLFRKLNAIAGKVLRGSLGSPNSLEADNQYRAINLAGKDLVGIYANGGKAVYLNLDENGKFSPTGINSPLNMFGGTYQQFSQNEVYSTGKKGLLISILQDIFVNFATDNAKVQALEPMNQNTITAPMTVMLNRLGVPTIYQTLLFNSNLIRRITDAYKAMNDVTRRTVTIENKSISAFTKEAIVSSARTALGVTRKTATTDVTLEEILDLYTADPDKLTDAQKEVAGRVLNLFQKIETLTNEFRLITKATAGLNSSFKDLNGVTNTLDAVSKLTEPDRTNFKNAVNKVPHLAANQDYLRFVKSTLEENFLSNTPLLQQFISLMKQAFKIDVTNDVEVARFESAVEQFAMSSLPILQKFAVDEKFRVGKEELVGHEAFKERFVNKMISMSKDLGDIDHPGAIAFLRKLGTANRWIVNPSGRGILNLNRLTFDAKSVKDDLDVMNIRSGIRYLLNKHPELRDELVAYTILEYGLQFQANSFTRFLPAEIFSDSVKYLAEEGYTKIYQLTQDPMGGVFGIQHARKTFNHTPVNKKRAMLSHMGYTMMAGVDNVAPFYHVPRVNSEDVTERRSARFGIRVFHEDDVHIFMMVPTMKVTEYDNTMPEGFDDPHKTFNLMLNNIFVPETAQTSKQVANELMKNEKAVALPQGSLVRVLRNNTWPNTKEIYQRTPKGFLKVADNKLNWNELREVSRQELERIKSKKSEIKKLAAKERKEFIERMKAKQKEAEDLRNKCQG